MKRFIASSSLVLVATFFAACTVPPSSSHVLVGNPREPIPPEEVQVFNTPPPTYEEIALLDASSRNSWAFSDQEKMDITIIRLKEEAAKLGANGVLLKKIDDVYIETTSSTTTTTVPNSSGDKKGGKNSPPPPNSSGNTSPSAPPKPAKTNPTVVQSSTTSTSVAAEKIASAIAIYVPEGEPSHTEQEKQKLAQLKILKELFDEGVISQTEYDTRRKKVLESK